MPSQPYRGFPGPCLFSVISPPYIHGIYNGLQVTLPVRNTLPSHYNASGPDDDDAKDVVASAVTAEDTALVIGGVKAH